MEIHLAGHQIDAAGALLVDSHDTTVAPAVWDLYQRLLARTGALPTLIERDGDIPDFSTLLTERLRAHDMLTASQEQV